MARPALDKRDIEEFRDRVVSVALDLFADDGLEAVTLRAIADQLGCSAAKIYNYFDGKEAILAATRAECFRRFADFIEDRLEGVEDPETVLFVQGRSYLEYARRQPHAFKIMFTLDRAPAEEFREIRRAIRRSWNIVRRGVRQAVEAGVLVGSVDEIADLLWSGIHGITTLDLAGTPGPEWDPSALADSMFLALIDAHRPDHCDADLDHDLAVDGG
ncbi:MAG: TetR/AcrR family transcriptional regulator [Persicimonas sp.]